MKLIKITLLASIMGFAINAMANEVIINNNSDHPIPVKYQLAYHNPGKRVVLKGKSQEIVTKKSSINVPLNGYNHAGIIVLAVKRNVSSTHWHYLPKSANQFDGTPGCWMRTDAQKRSGNIVLSYHAKSNGQRAHITCSANN